MKSEFISHYKILEKLGQGGMGVVYKAHDTKLDRFVALKFLPSDLAQSDTDKARFLQEARAAAALNHPNVCVIYEIEEGGDQPYIAMEFVDGTTLKNKLQEEPLELKTAIEYAIQIAGALQAAHDKGIVHRDIKSENIMITGTGQVKVMDFGLAKIRGAAKLTKTTSTMGTLAYMPPEHIQGREIDARADIFSFGVVFYEMLTGHLPFKGEYDSAIMYSIVNDEPEPVQQYRSDLSSEMLHVLNRALEKDPDERYQSAKDMLIDLKRLKRDTENISRKVPVVLASEKEKPTAVSPGKTKEAHTGNYKMNLKKISLPIALTAVAVAILIFVILPTGHSEYAENRIVVVPFENKTNDKSLDMLGQMAAEMITQSISQLSFLEAVPFVSVTETYASSEENLSAYEVAEQKKAGVMITGTYYFQDNKLLFRASITDTKTKKLLRSLTPEQDAPDSSQTIIKKLSDRILSSLAIQLYWKIPANQTYIPSFAAYKEFSVGLELFGRDYHQARIHFLKALEIDSAFTLARTYIATSYTNQGNYAKADSIYDLLYRRRDELFPYDRLGIDWGMAFSSGNNPKALRILKKLEELSPNNTTIKYLIGLTADEMNMPRKTVETFREINNKAFMSSYGIQSWWYSVWIDALYLLGDYKEGLRIIEFKRNQFPDESNNYTYEVTLQAALGEIREVHRVIDESFELSSADQGKVMRYAAMSLRAHGYKEDAHKICKRALEWYRSRAAGDHRYQIALILYLDEQWKETQSYFEQLSAENPENQDYSGYVGVSAARLGEREKANKLSEEFYKKDEPYLFGSNLHWCARIAAVLGDKQRAVNLLREAYGRGYGYGIDELLIMDFESLKDYEPYIELMRPKG